MKCRHVYAMGIGLGLVGSLAAVAGMVLAGAVTIGVLGLGATVTFAICLVNVFRREDFDRDHSLAYRAANWGGALFVVGLGLLLLGVGVVSLATFG